MGGKLVSLVSVVLLTALALSGPLAPLAWAEQKVEGQMAPEKKTDAWGAAATVTNVFYIPGKAILCGLGGVTGGVILFVTFGTAYTWAGRAWEEGCAGRWAVTADDVRPETTDSDFWMERREFRRY